MRLLLEASIPATYVLLGALIGSASGVLISKIFDLIQISKQHKLTLQKEFFTRKLDVLEKTVAFWTNTQGIFQGLEMAIKSLLNPDHYFDDATSEKIINDMAKTYNDINDQSKVLVCSLKLYADVPPEYYLTDSIIEYFNVYGELGYLIESARNQQTSEKQFREDVAEKMKKLTDISMKVNRKSNALIELLRLDLKKFDF